MVDRPLNEWMTDDILTLKGIRRKNELIWRKTRTTINVDIYYDSCKAVKRLFVKENQNGWNKGSLIVKVSRKNCFLCIMFQTQCISCQNRIKGIDDQK